MELTRLLKTAGFSEKEASVYLALLSHGPAGATDIAERARINRSTTYVILDTLMKRGLVTDTGKDSISMFDAGKPTQLVEYFKRAANHFRTLASEAESLIPAFENQSKFKPSVEEPIYGAALSSLGRIHSDAKNSVDSRALKKPSPRTKLAGEAA